MATVIAFVGVLRSLTHLAIVLFVLYTEIFLKVYNLPKLSVLTDENVM